MDRLIHTAFSGLSSSMQRQRVIASNMANAQTIGFRADLLAMTPMTLEGPGLEVRAANSTEVRGANMKAGSVNRTGRGLDIAMEGNVMLAVQASDGTEAYTRRGDLNIAASGLLVNGEGAPVVGEGGPITIPPGREAIIAPDGQILLRDPATPDVPPVRLDRIKLASPAGTRIEKGLDGLFRVFGGGVLPGDEEGRVMVGALEQSNVSATEVLTEMIEAQRLFDIRTKLVATARDIDEGGAALMRIT
ncbi:flagellar basal body rod protein FlgF [Novosphingobium sp. TH158]|uniref:flagellar basal body rod protein FlgF n=1 Tax=Novosphingobium sp. TH158 TaxID=2067455 RepID=UPI000C7E803A|nr:flagellar basal body rod protein FlgF [Novosphingobium sp. TH158]PLK27649.1 flagellar biosynthesis protein FlgF [Novosphingobium sp. TH158]